MASFSSATVSAQSEVGIMQSMICERKGQTSLARTLSDSKLSVCWALISDTDGQANERDLFVRIETHRNWN